MPRTPGRARRPARTAMAVASLVTSIVLMALPLAAAHAQPAPPVAQDFALDDQFGRAHPVRFADAPLTLLVFSGRTSHREGEAWLRGAAPALRAVEPRLRAIEVAAVGHVPRLMRSMVLGVFRRQPAIPLDWGDVVAGRFGYRDGQARALLVDAQGRVLAAASGAPDEGSLARFVEAARPVP